MSDTLITLAIVFGVAIEIVGVLFAFDSIMRGRTPQGTLAWALALVLIPIVAVPLYFLIGARRFDGYVRARRRGKLGLDVLATQANDAMRPFRVKSDEHGHEGCLSRLQLPSMRLTTTRWTTGNRTTLLIDGANTFEAIFAAIGVAQRDVCVQFYIVRDDKIGRQLQAAMIAAANRGVRVHFLYDAMGSNGLTRAFTDELEEAGVFVASFRTVRKLNIFRSNFRNHRKVVVVDGQSAFIGGLNIGREYLGLDPEVGPWRDTHLRIDGPAALAAQLSFVEDWHWVTQEIPKLGWTTQSRGNENVLIVPSGPSDSLETCALLFHQVIQCAQSRLWIATPYFVPDEGITLSLQLASLRGVDARIMIPEKSDNKMIGLSAYSYYQDVMPSGVDIYRYQPGFMHHKVFLIDDLVGVGTANFDNRSFRINFEITAVVIGGPLVEQVQQMWNADLANCHRAQLSEFTSRPWLFRAIARACRLMSPLQ